MQANLAEEIVAQFERGGITRRQMAARLMGLGAALAALRGGGGADAADGPADGTFHATGLDHIALDVRDVARSRDFYIKHLGLTVLRDGGADTCFLAAGKRMVLTLFRGDKPGLNHYSYAIDGFDADKAEAKLTAAGFKVRRESDRIYFPDPDGIEVQISGS